jgi:hypothetical protein
MTKEDSNTAPPPSRETRKPGVPRGFRMRGSISDQIANLQPGESVSRCVRLNPIDATPERIQTEYQTMTSGLGSGLYRLDRDKPGTADNFKTERGQCFTNDGAVLLVVAVTRLK